MVVPRIDAFALVWQFRHDTKIFVGRCTAQAVKTVHPISSGPFDRSLPETVQTEGEADQIGDALRPATLEKENIATARRPADRQSRGRQFCHKRPEDPVYLPLSQPFHGEREARLGTAWLVGHVARKKNYMVIGGSQQKGLPPCRLHTDCEARR